MNSAGSAVRLSLPWHRRKVEQRRELIEALASSTPHRLRASCLRQRDALLERASGLAMFPGARPPLRLSRRNALTPLARAHVVIAPHETPRFRRRRIGFDWYVVASLRSARARWWRRHGGIARPRCSVDRQLSLRARRQTITAAVGSSVGIVALRRSAPSADRHRETARTSVRWMRTLAYRGSRGFIRGRLRRRRCRRHRVLRLPSRRAFFFDARAGSRWCRLRGRRQQGDARSP